MSQYTYNELKQRAFMRAASALHSFWEEQKDIEPRTVSVHSRIFETLISNDYIILNKKAPDRKYPEHVVPCAYIRNHAFDMYWDGQSIDDVAEMIGQLLHIAYITDDEAATIDKKHKYTMPDDWNPNEDSILRRLEDDNIPLLDVLDNT